MPPPPPRPSVRIEMGCAGAVAAVAPLLVACLAAWRASLADIVLTPYPHTYTHVYATVLNKHHAKSEAAEEGASGVGSAVETHLRDSLGYYEESKPNEDRYGGSFVGTPFLLPVRVSGVNQILGPYTPSRAYARIFARICSCTH